MAKKIFAVLSVMLLLVLLAGCQKPEAPREGKLIGVEKIHQKRWRAVCLDRNGETFEVSVYRYEKKICGDRIVSGEDLVVGRIREGALPGYEKEFQNHLAKVHQ